jgi:hypothetical protein
LKHLISESDSTEGVNIAFVQRRKPANNPSNRTKKRSWRK